LAWTLGPTERRELFYGHVLTSLEAAKEIRVFGFGRFLRERMHAERRVSDVGKRRADRRELTVDTALGVLAATVAGATLLWAALAVRGGSLGVGDLAMVVAAVAGVQGALSAVVGGVAGAHQQLLMFHHYVALVEVQPDLPIATQPRPVPALRTGIELHDVWFRYSNTHPWILRGVSLFIPAGESTALVGLNGAGKSTLVKLLCRYYDPTRGEIRWDGVDLRDVDVAELRRRLSVVFQDHMNYELTAAENIAVGDIGALSEPERIRAAAGRAGVNDAVATLPRGYDTLLTRMFLDQAATADATDPEVGVVLSGGQWQRLALARAFLRTTPDLTILDEPSSGLDAEAEAEIHQRLRGYRAGGTSLLISHRLNTVREADLIVVLSSGTVAEQGSHDELMAADGEYARLFRLQAAGYLAGGETALSAAMENEG
jgi:ATP-binding cassette subfamily B protein